MTTRGAIARARRGSIWLAAIALCVAMTNAALAQSPSPQPEKPGLLESIGRWFERGFAGITSGLGSAKSGIEDISGKAATAGKDIGEKAGQAGKGAADATKGAVDAMMKLPSARMIRGRVRCDVSPNGAPDCRSAALSLCATKGYSTGTSVDFVSAEKCPPAVWMGRRKAEPGECVTETFVTRALCQ